MTSPTFSLTFTTSIGCVVNQPHQSAVYLGVPAITLQPLININATSVKILNASTTIFLVPFEPNET